MPQPPILIDLGDPWPRYQLICGVVKRILSPESVPEEWEGRQWAEEKLQH
jgi:hypothetical protein